MQRIQSPDYRGEWLRRPFEDGIRDADAMRRLPDDLAGPMQKNALFVIDITNPSDPRLAAQRSEY